MSINIPVLKQYLTLDLNDLSKLEEALAVERRALSSNNLDLITKASQRKNQLLSAVRSRAKEKSRLLVQSGHKLRAGEITLLIESQNDRELTSLWKAVNEKLNQCKEQNAVNGKVVNLSLQRLNKMMNIVRGQHNKPNLYGSKGHEQSMGGKHIIGKA